MTVDSGQLTVMPKLTIDNGQLTIIGASNVVPFSPPVKVCRERPREAPKNLPRRGRGTAAAVDEGRYGVAHCRNNGRRGRHTESHRRERPMCRSLRFRWLGVLFNQGVLKTGGETLQKAETMGTTVNISSLTVGNGLCAVPGRCNYNPCK